MTPNEEIDRYKQQYLKDWPNLLRNPESSLAVEDQNAVKVGELVCELVHGNLRTTKQLATHKVERVLQDLTRELLPNQAKQ